ncbi:MAG: LytTR family DNA-binding domain-containing protein [Saprospiraceae bacterium]|nr:LytTR family DNA-binding domain-containing protein [Saprospiraceae bacterium]
MIEAVVIEDEGVAARRLVKMLNNERIHVTQILKSNQELQAFLDGKEMPDLFFMDIHLNDGIVFETLQKVKVATPIIFTTAYDEFAIRAFKQKSVDYLLKPIDKEELSSAIHKFKSMFSDSKALDIQAISKLLRSPRNTYRERIKVKIGDRFRSIKMTDVSMIYSASKITFICTEDGRSYPIDQSLEAISDEMDPSQFHRLNRSQMVNIDFISDVVSYSNSRLKVKVIGSEDVEIVVSRERVKIFKDWLG